MANGEWENGKMERMEQWQNAEKVGKVGKWKMRLHNCIIKQVLAHKCSNTGLWQDPETVFPWLSPAFSQSPPEAHPRPCPQLA